MDVPPTDCQRRPENSQEARVPPPAIRVSAFILREGRILFVRQQSAVRSYWLLPGGGVERGESLTAAVARETREECGLEVEVLDTPLALVESISPDSGKSRHLVQLVFAARLPAAGEAVPRDPAVREVAWFTPEDLGSLVIHPPIRDLLVSWSAYFRQSIGVPLPPFVAVGQRWVD
jgi:8-oxo-dGTP diphosphatase